MTWFAAQRQDWIAEALRVYGFINRAHLMRKFSISRPQASADLAAYRRRHPRAVHYDARAKCYQLGARRDG